MPQPTDSTAKIKLKSLKASPELHRQIKRESAETGEKIEALVERAWTAYKASTSPPDFREKSSHKPAPDQSALASESMGLLAEIEAAGRHDLARIAVSTLRSMALEARNGQVAAHGGRVDLAQAKRNLDDIEASERSVIEESGEDVEAVRGPDVPGTPRRRA